jgi:hypothetical protein
MFCERANNINLRAAIYTTPYPTTWFATSCAYAPSIDVEKKRSTSSTPTQLDSIVESKTMSGHHFGG